MHEALTCVEKVFCWWSSTVPRTPRSWPSFSLIRRCIGYEYFHSSSEPLPATRRRIGAMRGWGGGGGGLGREDWGEESMQQ